MKICPLILHVWQQILEKDDWTLEYAFLETLDNREIVKWALAHKEENYPGTVKDWEKDYLIEAYTKWPNPDDFLGPDWNERFPYLWQRLRGNSEKRIFLRLSEFANCDPEFMASRVESVLAEHMREQCNYVKRRIFPGSHYRVEPERNSGCFAHAVQFYSQIAPSTFRLVILHATVGKSISRDGTFIKWSFRHSFNIDDPFADW